MKKIPLTQGKFALVDDEDYDHLTLMGKWHYMNVGYAKTSIGGRKNKQDIYLHRFIAGLQHGDGKVIDHINGDKLDNRKENLRVCKQSENCANRGLNKNNTSGFKGVCFDKRKNKWMAKIQVNRKYIFCGYAETPEQAALKYNIFATKHFGEFAVLNNIHL